MKIFNDIVVVLLSVGFLIASAIGGYVLLVQTYGLFANLDQSLIAVLAVVLIGTFVIAISIRRAADAQGEQRLRFEKKAQCYQRLIETWREVLSQPTGPQAKEAMAAFQATEQQLVLWASSNVIKQFAKCRRMNPQTTLTDPAMHLAVENVLREIRRDLGQNSMGIKEDDLLSLYLGEPDIGPSHHGLEQMSDTR